MKTKASRSEPVSQCKTGPGLDSCFSISFRYVLTKLEDIWLYGEQHTSVVRNERSEGYGQKSFRYITLNDSNYIR